MSTMKTLLEQLRVTETELRVRKHLLDFSEEDVDVLTQCRAQVEQRLDTIVDTFYGIQTSNPEIATLIGDADTLDRLQAAQRRYILDLFAGSYDLEYANNRLRIGLVHKRIGVEPKYYLSAVYLLRRLLVENLADLVSEEDQRKRVIKALDKLIYFDVTLVFETYIQSMLSEIEAVKTAPRTIRALEETVSVPGE